MTKDLTVDALSACIDMARKNAIKPIRVGDHDFYIVTQGPRWPRLTPREVWKAKHRLERMVRNGREENIALECGSWNGVRFVEGER